MAFHPYPRVVPSVFNRSGFGPPRGLTPASACPRIAHPASRRPRATARPFKGSLSLRLVSQLNLAAQGHSLAHSTKGTPSQSLMYCSDCSGAHGFRRCFTPLSGCFSPFPHGTGSLSVTGECSALEGGPPCFGPGFTCPALLWDGLPRGTGFRVRGSHPLRPAFPCRSATASLCDRSRGAGTPGRPPNNPGGATPLALCRARRFGLVRFRSPLLAQSRLISLPLGT